MKFTFKTEKPSGKYRSFFDDHIDIKYNKKVVGEITPKFPHKIRLMVIKNEKITDNNPNCNWKWITLKKDFESIDEAKLWINDKKSELLNVFELKHQ